MAVDWNKDWKPGPFPTTPEQRVAAAKRYGLRVEDYDVYDHDGMGYGDYPKLPMVSGDAKDPYEDWDIPALKRNYGEPVSLVCDHHMLSVDVIFNHCCLFSGRTVFPACGILLFVLTSLPLSSNLLK